VTAQEQAPRRVFIVEDETLVAMLIEDMLEELGYTTAAHASTVDEGIAYALAGHYELAILDINIIGGSSFAIASAVAQRGIPFLFCSGYGGLGIPAAWAAQQCVAKPFGLAQLGLALEALLPKAG